MHNLPFQGSGFLAGRILGLLAGFLLLLSAPVDAQTNEAKPRIVSNRYLFLVETSRSMQKRGEGAVKVVQDLLRSNLRGQMRRGDTFGIWTFNEELYAGRFPLQRWAPEGQEPITQKVVAFIKAQKFEKQSKLDKVLPALRQVIQDSEFITVILVTDGEEKLHGTPFDAEINRLFAQWHDEQQKARMPLVTVLRAQRGKIINYTVNAAPWPVEMPMLPPELLVPLEVTEKKREPAPVKAVVPSLIISGKKPALTNSETQKSDSTLLAASAKISTNETRLEPLTVGAAKFQADIFQAAPAKLALTENKSDAPDTAVSKAAQSPEPPQIQPIKPIELPKPSNFSGERSNPAVALAPKSEPSTNNVVASIKPSAPSPSVGSSVGLPAHSFLSGKTILLLALVLLGILGWTAFAQRRRAQTAGPVSLITRSLDRDKT